LYYHPEPNEQLQQRKPEYFPLFPTPQAGKPPTPIEPPNHPLATLIRSLNEMLKCAWNFDFCQIPSHTQTRDKEFSPQQFRSSCRSLANQFNVSHFAAKWEIF